MAQFRTDLLWCLGWSTQGDLGPLTMYTSRRGNLVFFDKAPPLNPPSQLQIYFRDRWRIAAAAWRDLTDEQRATWLLAARRANLMIGGYNLWIYWRTTEDSPSIETIERQTGLVLM